MNVNDVLEAERLRLAALQEKNIQNLEPLLAPTLTYIHSNGKVDDRAAVIAKLNTGFRYHSLARRELAVQLYGDTAAVMTGVLDVDFSTQEGAPVQTLSVQITQVWIEQDSTVQLAAYHVSKIQL